jgi:tripartite-type tricarboxylate transporter receptor subunit TctC
MYTPKGVPQPILDKLNAALKKSLTSPDVKKRLDVMGVTASPGTPAAYGDQIKTDLARYADVVKAAQIKAN